MIPKISIIVPVYNSEKYIKKCLDSILNQTLSDIEIILINDGSTDNTKNIIEDYANTDSRIILINQENSGPSVSRNKGINIARGKYLGFVDADDYLEPNMYEELYYLASKNKSQIAMCAYREVYCYEKKEIEVKTKLNINTIYNKSKIISDIVSTFAKNENYGFYSLWNKIYLREWILDLGIYMDIKRDHGEDWWFNINLLSNAESYIYTDKVLYNYIHTNSNSLMVKYRENQFELFLDGRKKIESIVPKEFIDYKELNNRFIYEFSSYIIRTFKEVKDKEKKSILINNVLKNKDVIECCKNTDKLPIHFKITTLFIKFKMWIIAKIIYKYISIVI